MAQTLGVVGEVSRQGHRVLVHRDRLRGACCVGPVRWAAVLPRRRTSAGHWRLATKGQRGKIYIRRVIERTRQDRGREQDYQSGLDARCCRNASDWLSTRETCIWEMPTCSAI